MKRIHTPLLAVAILLATASATVAQKQTPPGKVPVSLKASANPVTYSTPLTLTVSVKGASAGQQVKFQRKATTGAYVDLATATTNDKGDATTVQRPRRNTIYRAVTVEATPRASTDLLVKVAPLVGFRVSDSTPSKGARITFRGTVRPQHDGRRVQIQRKQADGSWLTVARPTLLDTGRSYSKYSRRIRISATAVYRVVIAEHSDHAAGVSRERTLTVGA